MCFSFQYPQEKATVVRCFVIAIIVKRVAGSREMEGVELIAQSSLFVQELSYLFRQGLTRLEQLSLLTHRINVGILPANHLVQASSTMRATEKTCLVPPWLLLDYR